MARFLPYPYGFCLTLHRIRRCSVPVALNNGHYPELGLGAFGLCCLVRQSGQPWVRRDTHHLARTHLQTCMSSFSSVPRVDFENLQQDLFADLARLLLSYAELEQRREELVNTVVELASSSAGPVQALGVRVLPSGGLEPHRVQACANISAWIARCLAGGQNRGKSGRDKIGEPIHFYLVIKGKKNQLHNPPTLFGTWQETEPFCYERGLPTNCAMFIGH